jgi:hypothetical protein
LPIPQEVPSSENFVLQNYRESTILKDLQPKLPIRVIIIEVQAEDERQAYWKSASALGD